MFKKQSWCLDVQIIDTAIIPVIKFGVQIETASLSQLYYYSEEE